ncbi:hypothetical protein SAMD00023353_0400630 [Rosellinia necatrix]|uniref:Uncharacterized protein n=1 Tax=Rosellinia necatrix TaxID=77044 RepID=A0A1S7UIJ6_ROSNE|nr:hypothetical protein SAMD00023353_0400630 [Rosellinia necatrix]
MVFLFVVVCVPSVPAVAKSIGATKVFASVKMWASHYRRHTKSSGKDIEPSASEKAPYEQVEEYGPKGAGGGQGDNY